MAKQSSRPAEKVTLDATEGEIEEEAAQQSPYQEPKDTIVIDVASQELEAEQPKGQQRRGKSKETCNCNKCFKRWEKPLVAAPFTIAITIMGALWSATNNKDLFDPTSSIFIILILVVVFNFYISVVAILLSYLLPDLYHAFLAAAFISTLISLTILFCAILPRPFHGIPWTFLAFILLTCLILAVHGRLRPH
ncbi:hypothetical protein CRG98_003973 [Punica granatum]|uniref:Uncharacterized protein n=1 Tax=Punica granatum TaxID=22663 RepID=A0A2I0L4F1_PUNGR|nr:hypothetical protein CRG98_003973 [Punica granatum]